MHCVYVITGSLAIVAASFAGDQESSGENMPPCIAEPVFHCVRHFDGGTATAYFGYTLQCSGDEGPAAELFIDIGDDNKFSPGRIDRGQTILFLSGEHMDEYSVDFTAAEVEAGLAVQWSVLDKVAEVDFTKTKDEYLDCSNLQ